MAKETVASLAKRIEELEAKAGSSGGSNDFDTAAFEQWRREQFPSQ